ncbi:MAG: hypothetical protein ACJAW8_001610 [Oleispira sp.]|jgi:hypothetical protein
MIKGLSITPPVIGRISIGRTIERDGKRLPSKDDQFTLTSQVQTKDGWALYPLDEQLRSQQQTNKLRTIPIRLPFSCADLNLRAEYSMFDRKTGRPVCTGDGISCQRSTAEGIQQMECPGSANCEYGKSGNCKLYGRLTVQVGDGDDHDFGCFILRTTSFNTIRALYARMLYYNAASGGLLHCMPLQLRLRGKSTTMSYRSAIYYVDLELAEGMSMKDAVTQAKATQAKRVASGIDQCALDNVASMGFANGQFEFNEEETPEVLEEFYPTTSESNSDGAKSEIHSQKLHKLRSRLDPNSTTSH